MKNSRMKKISIVVLTIVVGAYIYLVIINSGHEIPMNKLDIDESQPGTIAIFGATGTIGDGLLKAAINDPNTHTIHVVTRRMSPRIEAAAATGRVVVHLHEDYLDYTEVRDVLAKSDAVFWAIGLSSAGMDEESYRRIHVEFPVRAVTEWSNHYGGANGSFHYVSGAGANIDSRMMWARVKAEAEAELARIVDASELRVVSYRPSFITPTEAEIRFYHKVANFILSPIGSVIRAEEIGEGMLETSRRKLANGTVLENRDILSLSKLYEP